MEDDLFFVPVYLFRDPIHMHRMGNAIWLALYIIQAMQAGQPIDDDQIIAERMQAPLSSVKRWRKKLISEGYLEDNELRIPAYVYVVQCGDFNLFKIGISRSPEERIISLQIGNPFELKLVYCKHSNRANIIESKAHKRFKGQSVSGEWFEAELKAIVNFLNKIIGE